MSRRKRPPSEEEIALWDMVTRSVAPLKPRKPAKSEPVEAAAAEIPPAKPAPAKPLPPAPTPKPKPAKPPSLASLDRRTLSRVNRGAMEIDARIDLHGMTQAAAHSRLIDFLFGTQASGARLVLVITGKGKNGAESERERGVLRRLVPIWLASYELRSVVVGFDEAGRAHGGAGALLVRLRRAQRPGRGAQT
jgi:DNA-nicking Smr family endonuclease